MHLAAINNQPEVMEFFLSHNKASILRNGDNQTILDISVSLEMKEVAVVIAKHDRYYNPLFIIADQKCYSFHSIVLRNHYVNEEPTKIWLALKMWIRSPVGIKGFPNFFQALRLGFL